MPSSMEDILRALLSIRCVDFDSFDIVMPESSFKPIGVATAVPDFDVITGRTLIWHAPSEILPITRSELDRFEMDAPDGFHLILSERTTHSDCDPIDETKFQIISPNQVSEWIGSAVLSGDLAASVVPGDSNLPESNDLSTYSNEEEMQVLTSKIDIDSWTASRGIEGFSSSPMLLEHEFGEYREICTDLVAVVKRANGQYWRIHGLRGSASSVNQKVCKNPQRSDQ